MLLLGKKVPPNYGEEYVTEFSALFERVALEAESAFVPLFLEGVADDPDLNLLDGMHPTTEGHTRIAGNLIPVMRELSSD